MTFTSDCYTIEFYPFFFTSLFPLTNFPRVRHNLGSFLYVKGTQILFAFKLRFLPLDISFIKSTFIKTLNTSPHLLPSFLAFTIFYLPYGFSNLSTNLNNHASESRMPLY